MKKRFLILFLSSVVLPNAIQGQSQGYLYETHHRINTVFLLGDTEILDKELTDNTLAHISKVQLRLLKNMIYARYGFLFKTVDLRDYFLTFSWYRPRFDNVDFFLTGLDKLNINKIVEWEYRKDSITSGYHTANLTSRSWNDIYPSPSTAYGYSFNENGNFQYHDLRNFKNIDARFTTALGSWKIEHDLLFIRPESLIYWKDPFKEDLSGKVIGPENEKISLSIVSRYWIPIANMNLYSPNGKLVFPTSLYNRLPPVLQILPIMNGNVVPELVYYYQF